MDVTKVILVGTKWMGGENYSILLGGLHTRVFGKIISFKVMENYLIKVHYINSYLIIGISIRFNNKMRKDIGSTTKEI